MNSGNVSFVVFPKGVTVFGKMTTLESFSHSANILGSDSAQVVLHSKAGKHKIGRFSTKISFFHPAIEYPVFFIPIPTNNVGCEQRDRNISPQ